MIWQWQTGNPPKHGFYLATWIRGEVPVVSELWFNPDASPQWWINRAYLGDKIVSRKTHPMDGAVKQGVIAWMNLPEPANLEK